MFLAKVGAEMAVKHVIKRTIFHSGKATSAKAKEVVRAEKALAKMDRASFKALKISINNSITNQIANGLLKTKQ